MSEVDQEDIASERSLFQKTAEEEKMTYPTFLDAGGTWQKSVGIEGIPSFVVVDREGKIRYKYKGKLIEGEEPFKQLEAALQDALGKS